MSRRLPVICTLALSALGLLASPALAQFGGPPAQYRGYCRPDGTGPMCDVWMAKVTSISDGDTVHVRFDGHDHSIYAIRFAGIQAMEQTVYSRTPSKRRGDCHALEATSFISNMINRAHGRVRLTAQQHQTDQRGRLFRSIAAKIGGRWQDIGQAEMARGLTLWMPVLRETAWNLIYDSLAQHARAQQIGMWDPTYCGEGPHQDIPLQVTALSDPIGADNADIDGEWIKVHNPSPTNAVSLARWWVRDSGLRRYTFPPGTVLQPGHTITVYAGSGYDDAEDFYWGLPGTIFSNTANGNDTGDGAYLFDPQGDLRAELLYPCLVSCADPNQGALTVTPHATGTESVQVADSSDHPVDLEGYELRLPSGAYPFPANSLLQPGETMEIDVAGSPADDTRLNKHIGIDAPILANAGGTATVSTFDEIPLGCGAWGTGECPDGSPE